MAKNPLGKLERVDLRNYWEDEAREFTPWLARPENIALLSEELEMDLEVMNQEESVGPFKADILAKDIRSGQIVVIENQLELTDHKHLGQLITYAAGLKASSIIWISSEFYDEHRAALDWLNGLSEQVNFFGIEVQLWRIGDSTPAPRFNIISKPNQWEKRAHEIVEFNPTAREKTLLEFWEGFVDFVKKTGNRIRTRKPQPQNFMDFSLGTSNFVLTSAINMRDEEVGFILWIGGEDRDAHYNALKSKYEDQARDQIDPNLAWEYRPDKKFNQVRLTLNRECRNKEKWPEIYRTQLEYLEKFREFFAPKIKEIE